MAGLNKSVLVLYGSETGNAQDMAEELGKLCSRLHFDTEVEELNNVDLNALLQNELVLFVISTTGQGDMPHNSLLFWKKLLRRRLPPDCLKQMNYTCFGLGDSTYVKFNWAARKLIRRLEQLGASQIFENAEADEQFENGIEGAFSIWAEKLSKQLYEQYTASRGLEVIPDHQVLPARWSLKEALDKTQKEVKVDDTTTSLLPDPAPSISGPPSPRPLPLPDGWDATLMESHRLTPEQHWQEVRLVSFRVPHRQSSNRLQCNPGDCLTIYPKNFPEDVHRLIRILGWEHVADVPLDLAACSSLPRNLFAPEPCTIRNLLLENVDITAIPRRSFLKSLSYFASNPEQKERLLEFTKNEFIDEYFDYATRTRRSILEVLEEFNSVKLPPERLFDVFPLIRGRDFSIANGGAKTSPPELAAPAGANGTNTAVTGATPSADNDTRVDLLVALVRYRTILRKPREGLCSRYLASMPIPSPIRVTHKPVLSSIHGASNARRPLIAMATGTGVAPVRCLVHERLTHPDVGPMLLFFGNRNRHADFFFADEWEDLVRQGRLQLFTAFSRDQEKKVYVQHLVRRESARIAELMPLKPIFAVCGGSSKMADACKEAVFEPFEKPEEQGQSTKGLEDVTWWQEIW